MTSHLSCTIGIDFGGSKIRTGRVEDGRIVDQSTKQLHRALKASEVMDLLINSIESTLTDQVESIGIGVPGTVDITSGTVYELENVPSWTFIPLKQTLEARFGLPVFVNNDANCFVWGEKLFGHGIPFSHLVGLTIGTGLGGGIVINNQLYNGRNCGAGEFGVLPYLDHTIEYYASGHFFKINHTDGEVAFQAAKNGGPEALLLFDKLGKHLGQAVKMVLLTLDPEAIILGGSVSKAFPYFEQALRAEIASIPFTNVKDNFKLFVNDQEHIALLGAASLGRMTLPIYTNQ